MYLHQSNNLSNGITSTHSLNHSLNNSLSNSLKMSDLHDDAFHHHHLNSTQTNPSNHHFTDASAEQNEENYLADYEAYASNGKLVTGKLTGDQFEFADRTNDTKLSSLSCSPTLSISSAATTLNNITNISNNFITVNSTLSKQLNQLAEQTKLDSTEATDKLTSTTKFNVEQNEFIGMDPLTRFLSLHPKYLELFDKFYNFLFNGDGPLQYTVRHYIAIMVCSYIFYII